MNTTDKSNPVREVALLIVVIVIGLVGVYLRFADFRYASLVADFIFLIAIILMIRIVLKMIR